MIRFSVLILLAVALLTACTSAESRKKEIEAKENALRAQTKQGKVDTIAIKELLNKYTAFADAYPTDTTGANYLFKAADFDRYMHYPKKSIELYGRIYNNYPSFIKRPYALFLQGFMYENELGNLDSARTKYQQFLTSYPNHAISRDVQITLANLGKKPEDLIQEFESKTKTDSTQQTAK